MSVTLPNGRQGDGPEEGGEEEEEQAARAVDRKREEVQGHTYSRLRWLNCAELRDGAAYATRAGEGEPLPRDIVAVRDEARMSSERVATAHERARAGGPVRPIYNSNSEVCAGKCKWRAAVSQIVRWTQ